VLRAPLGYDLLAAHPSCPEKHQPEWWVSPERVGLDYGLRAFEYGAELIADLSLLAGNRYPLLAIDAGEDDTAGTSAEAYRVWYQIARPDGEIGWVQAAVPTDYDTGSDGRPSSLHFDLLPDVGTPE
jgi:hypothetical protein